MEGVSKGWEEIIPQEILPSFRHLQLDSVWSLQLWCSGTDGLGS